MKQLVVFVLVCIVSAAQDLSSVLKRGGEVFENTCSSGYCHGTKGVGAGGPRLAARGLDQSYIETTLARGIPGTSMAAFSDKLPPADLLAVAAYVATLNGIANPVLRPPQNARQANANSSLPTVALSPEAQKGRSLFEDALRAEGFGRCSTCHQVNGTGIPVTTPITNVPENAEGLLTSATPRIQTVIAGGERTPALLVSKGSKRTIYFDLSSVPPVQRNVATTGLQMTQGSTWRHSSAIRSYSNSELESILVYLREAVQR